MSRFFSSDIIVVAKTIKILFILSECRRAWYITCHMNVYMTKMILLNTLTCLHTHTHTRVHYCFYHKHNVSINKHFIRCLLFFPRVCECARVCVCAWMYNEYSTQHTHTLHVSTINLNKTIHLKHNHPTTCRRALTSIVIRYSVCDHTLLSHWITFHWQK